MFFFKINDSHIIYVFCRYILKSKTLDFRKKEKRKPKSKQRAEIIRLRPKTTSNIEWENAIRWNIRIHVHHNETTE